MQFNNRVKTCMASCVLWNNPAPFTLSWFYIYKYNDQWWYIYIYFRYL